MSTANYSLVPLYNTNSNDNNNGGPNDGQVPDNLAVSTVDQVYNRNFEPYYGPNYYEHSQAYPATVEDFVNSEHHLYCYSHLEHPNESYIEEVLQDRRQSKTTRRVEFADMTRRKSRIAALRRRSRSRSQSEELEDEEEEEEESEADIENDENETGFNEFSESFNANRRESELLRFLRSARSRSPSLNAFRSCKRSQMHRVSLLGRPIHVRQPKHVNPRYRQLQNNMNKFLERPRGWKAMTYHVIMWVWVNWFFKRLGHLA